MSQFTVVLQEIAFILKKLHWQLVTAESCTGGLISSSITELAGSSLWFERGFITYSNLSKQELLSVPSELIATHGAVSKEVASAMAIGALSHSVGQIAVSVTGIAGPDGGSVDKPVGTVCFSWALRDGFVQTLKKQLGGDRHEIRMAACDEALSGVLRLLREKK